MSTRVINFFAGPGAGKSTTAAGLFFEMKHAGFRVELVTEYAKELCYAGRLGRTSQRRMADEQYARQTRLWGHVDYIVTDSPLLLPLVYCTEPAIHNMVRDRWNAFDNFSVWVDRTKAYSTYGRRETEAEARDVDRRLLALVEPHITVAGDRDAPAFVLACVRAYWGLA